MKLLLWNGSGMEAGATLNATSSYDAVVGITLLMGLLTSIRAQPNNTDINADDSTDSRFADNYLPSLPADLNPHVMAKRSTNEITPQMSRYRDTKGVRFRLNSPMNYFLHMENNSIFIDLPTGLNSTACMKQHIFRVAHLASGQFVILESRQGEAFLHGNSTGHIGIHNEQVGNVTSVTQTDNRFFRIFKSNEGDRYYNIQNFHTGQYLSTENNIVSLVSEEEFNAKRESVEFEMFECDATS